MVYYFNTSYFFVFIIEKVDKIAHCFFYLFLTWANNFPKVQIKPKIIYLNIIIT